RRCAARRRGRTSSLRSVSSPTGDGPVRSSLPVLPGLPQRLAALVGAAAEDEEQVREPVQVAHDLGVEQFGAADREPLRSPAHSSADVQLGRAGSAPGQYQRLQRLKVGVYLIATLLEPLALIGRDPQPVALRGLVQRYGAVGTEVDGGILNSPDPLGVTIRKAGNRQGDADLGL